MIFSRIAGSVSRARSRLQSNRCFGFRHGRIPAVTESCLEAKPCVYGGLGFATAACLRSNGGIGIGIGAANNYSILTIRRMFCSQFREKRNYDNTKIPEALEAAFFIAVLSSAGLVYTMILVYLAEQTANRCVVQNRCSGFCHGRIPGVTESCLEAKVATINNEQPNLATINNKQPNLATINNEQPNLATINDEQPNLATINDEQPNLATINDEQPNLATINDELPKRLISSQEFSNLPREPGLVDHIEVINGSIVLVFVRSFPYGKTRQQKEEELSRYPKYKRHHMDGKCVLGEVG